MVIGSVTITIFGIIAIFVIVLMAAAVCYFCMRANAQIDERRERREEQAYQQEMMIKQIQMCREAGIPMMFNHNPHQIQMPANNYQVYSENRQSGVTPAYSVKLLGR